MCHAPTYTYMYIYIAYLPDKEIKKYRKESPSPSLSHTKMTQHKHIKPHKTTCIFQCVSLPPLRKCFTCTHTHTHRPSSITLMHAHQGLTITSCTIIHKDNYNAKLLKWTYNGIARGFHGPDGLICSGRNSHYG